VLPGIPLDNCGQKIDISALGQRGKISRFKAAHMGAVDIGQYVAQRALAARPMPILPSSAGESDVFLPGLHVMFSQNHFAVVFGCPATIATRIKLSGAANAVVFFEMRDRRLFCGEPGVRN
jgi:hypothetical protein